MISASSQPTLTISRGASKTFRFLVRDSKNNLVDLTGAKSWFTIKNRVEDVDMLVRKRNAAAGGADSQMLVTLPQTGSSLGEVKAFALPADTSKLDPQAQYTCDAWVQKPDGTLYQVLKNAAFQVLPVVTVKF